MLKRRLALINKFEKITNSFFIALVYNTTKSRFSTQLASDMLPSFNDLIKSIPKDCNRDKVSLLLHSSGGTLDVITSFVYMMRKNFNEFNIIIPEIAHSAATILAFGADKILMSYYSSLSPVDPQLSMKTKTGIIGAGAEDINGFYTLINNLFKEDMAKIQAFNILVTRFPPEVLGRMERVQKQVKFIIDKLLGYQQLTYEQKESIISKFQKEFFSHEYRIHFDDAKAIGLNVILMDSKLEEISLDLLKTYKESFGGNSEIEINIPDDEDFKDVIIQRSFLECKYSSYSYKTKYTVHKDKKVDVESLGWQKNKT